jgi:hypothetical protein
MPTIATRLRQGRIRREAERLDAILNGPGPVTFRVTRAGWERASYLIDPENPGTALAIRPTDAIIKEGNGNAEG